MSSVGKELLRRRASSGAAADPAADPAADLASDDGPADNGGSDGDDGNVNRSLFVERDEVKHRRVATPSKRMPATSAPPQYGQLVAAILGFPADEDPFPSQELPPFRRHCERCKWAEAQLAVAGTQPNSIGGPPAVVPAAEWKGAPKSPELGRFVDPQSPVQSACVSGVDPVTHSLMEACPGCGRAQVRGRSLGRLSPGSRLL